MSEQTHLVLQRYGVSGADGFTLPGAEASYAPDLAVEPTHLDIALRFDIAAARAAGEVRTTVRGNRSGARKLKLDAVSLEGVAVESEAALDWRYDGEAIHLTWGEPFAAGEERVFAVRYAVQDPVSGMRFSHPDEAYPDRPIFVATDHETERARYWLPCVDYPTVRTTLDFRLTAPADLTILANGTLEGETDNGDGTKTAHWHLDHPCPSYLSCMAIGRFSRFDDEAVDGRPLAYFAADRHSPEDLQRSFGRTPAMMRWLEKRLGVPFPFKKYFQIALPEIGGAMENISLVTWDDLLLLDASNEKEWGQLVDAVNLHEMAHSYFGDAVVCRHFEHTWLKESWAVFMETVYWEEHVGTNEAHYDLHLNAERYCEEADKRYVRPIVTRTYNSSWDIFDAHTYPGGAWRIHMLRQLVGDEPFWAATRDYLETYGGKVVETEDLRRKLEQHSGLNLVRFFDQWVYGRGFPKLKASWKHDAEKNQATLVVEQKQKDKDKGIELLAFPLEFEYTDDDGVHRVALEIEEDRHSVVLSVKGTPGLLRVDPDCKVLFTIEFNPGEDLLRKVLTEATDVRNRIRAADELIKTGTRANLRAVGEAMSREPFWGVRATVAEKLGASGAAEAIEPLAAMLTAERDDRIKFTIATACGRMRDTRLRDALLTFLETGPPPLARARALTSLGIQRDERDHDLLAEAAGQVEPRGIVASGALRGLGALRSRRALGLLRERLPYGVEAESSRPAAVEAFGLCAARFEREQRAEAADTLIDLTRDPRDRVRLRAGAALAGIRAVQAIPALESLKGLHPQQDRPVIERMIAGLRKGPPGEDLNKLREQVEKLEERHRKLEERLQDLEAKGEKS